MPEVKRRKVFYIAGFDPVPPRRYREFYRREGAEQAAISGYHFTMHPRRKDGAGFGWQAALSVDGETTEADFTFLPWDDIVRAEMKNSIAATYGQMARTLWIYLSTGALYRMVRLRRNAALPLLFPIVILILQAFVAVLAGGALGALAGWAAALLLGVWGMGIGIIAAIAAAIAVLQWFKARDGKIMAYYLMHDYAFATRWRGAYAPAMAARIRNFAAQIRAATGYDEVLVVGHSSGTQIAISTMAEVLRAGPPDVPLALLTLGHVVPMMSFLPDGQQLRADLAYMGGQDRVFWLDVTAPGDACCFALCDPVAVTGVAPQPQTGPLVLSATFTQTLSSEKQAALKGKWFRLHFQYLHAFDRPGDYDYFLITAGPQRLASRYRGRDSSASRIAKVWSAYRDY
ncbi:hypothetical protein [Ketogulonicigenium vulgare]|uniref:hypothetical protein n=1 Tax=Ketogulonicigenium vulgare TaxID=92945 RepID=UPI002358A6B3|nr:hypothetical protein [Ketogulonicigenium vulgare]